MGLFVLLLATFVAFVSVTVWQWRKGQLIDPAFSLIAREILPGWKRYILWFSTAVYGCFAAICLWLVVQVLRGG